MFFSPRPISASFLAGGLLLAGCQPQQAGDETNQGAASKDAIPAAPLPVADPPMDREALLSAVARAASATALGLKEPGQRQLDGKRFEVRIRFGCPNPTDLRASAPSEAPFGIRFDPEARALRLRATPDLSIKDPAIAALAGNKVEAVEGFWMYRPWLLTDGCAAPSPQTQAGDTPSDGPTREPAAPPQQAGWRVGFAQFFTSDDARTGRRDNRAFETTKVLGADEQPSAQGYNLVLSGRLRQLPDGRVIACRVERPSVPPECVVSARFDHIRIEKPDDRTVIAEWSQ